MSLFDAYVPTRTPSSVEVRVRSSADGPVTLSTDATSVTLHCPNISYGGRSFYRYRFEGLPPDTYFQIEIHQQKGGFCKQIVTATLPRPSGQIKLRVGIMADLHLPRRSARLSDYRPGTKRLTGLGERYIRRIEALGADLIVLPGDLVDPCSRDTLDTLKEILGAVSIPCYPIIGNHEPWSPGGEALFNQALELPPEGFYSVEKGGVRLLMLSTPHQDSLRAGSRQMEWLKEQLSDADEKEDIMLFSHFSAVLHSCVQGYKNDGYQILDNHRDILKLIGGYPNVRIFAAGHKNVPSAMVRDRVVHTLSPQLIQFPCGYDIFHMYEGGVTRTTFEIDEQHYCESARAAYTNNWRQRYGEDHDRNFAFAYP